MDTKLTPELVEQLTALAMNAKEGDTFLVGKSEHTRRFLMIDAEERLTALLVDLIKDAPGKDLVTLFHDARAELRKAAAIILADYEAGEDGELTDKAIAAQLELLRKTRGVTNAQLLDVVIGQVHLQELGMMLGKLLIASGLFQALIGGVPLPRPTSAASA